MPYNFFFYLRGSLWDNFIKTISLELQQRFSHNFFFYFLFIFLSWHSIKWWELPEQKIILIQKRDILRLLSAPGRYIKRKVKSIYKKVVKKRTKKIVKIPNILENEVNNEENL